MTYFQNSKHNQLGVITIMSDLNRKQKILDGFKALAAGNADPLMSIYDPNVEWIIIGETKFSGTYNGLDDVGVRLLGPISELLDGHIKLTAENLISEGDFVVVQGFGESNVAAGGTYNNTYCWIYQWSGDQVVKVTEYLDTELVTKAFGAA